MFEYERVRLPNDRQRRLKRQTKTESDIRKSGSVVLAVDGVFRDLMKRKAAWLKWLRQLHFYLGRLKFKKTQISVTSLE